MGDAKVLIGFSSSEYIRHADFLPSLLSLEKPNGSLMLTVSGQSPAESRNTIAEQAIANDCTHVLFLDDDMIYDSDLLMKLLKHDKDIVSALYLLRTYPHFPAFFDAAFSNGYNRFFFLSEGTLPELKKGTNAGLGAVLVKIDVFKKMEKPWVRLGEVIKDGWCDDVGFFNRAREAGFDIYCDLETPVGHKITCTMWPKFVNGKWMTEYRHRGGTVAFPQHIRTEEEIRMDNEKNLTPV